MELLESGFERAVYRRRVQPTVWRRWVLHGLSLLSAFMVAGSIFFAGGLGEEEQVVVGAFPRPVFAEPPLTQVLPGFDAEALRARIEEIAEGRRGAYGVAVFDPTSGTRVSLGGDEEFATASIGKLPPFVALYRAAARGELDLEEEISILPTDVQGYGAGALHTFPVGHSLSLRECAYRLVNHSDNTAWMMLNRRLGEERIKAELEYMRAESGQYSNFSGYDATPNDVLLMLEKISDPRFTDEELSAEMLDAMTGTVFEDRIPEKLPRDVRVAHKTGSYGENFGDAGVVFYRDSRGVERRYYLVVLAEGAGEYEARDAIQSISLAVHETLAGAKEVRKVVRDPFSARATLTAHLRARTL